MSVKKVVKKLPNRLRYSDVYSDESDSEESFGNNDLDNEMEYDNETNLSILQYSDSFSHDKIFPGVYVLVKLTSHKKMNVAMWPFAKAT